MGFSTAELTELSRSVPLWWHSIDLGQGVVTPGQQPADFLAARVAALRLPDLRGKTVLDIGAYDGFYSFEAERRGAARVVALDHYVWSLDLPAHIQYWQDCKAQGTAPRPYHETPHWQPGALPGKRAFDTAHRARSSTVEAVVGDFMTIDPARLGTFDVVFFFGVLYHMEDPLAALRRVAAFARGLTIVETEAVHLPGYENRPLCEFFPSNELHGDVSNWWAPNEPALVGLCQAAGFTHTTALTQPPSHPLSFAARSAAKLLLARLPASARRYTLHPTRYRAIVHASR